MASSKVMSSRSPPNPDLPRQSPPSPLTQNPDHSRGFGSMNMEEILRNIYSDSDSFPTENNGGAGGGANVAEVVGGGGARNERGGGDTTMDEAWRDIVSSGGRGGTGDPAMTLEDYLAKAGAMAEEEVRVPAEAPMAPPQNPAGGYGMDSIMVTSAPPQNPAGGYRMDTVMVNHEVPAVQFGSAADRAKHGNFGVEFGNLVAAASGMGSGRGKRRSAVEEPPLDKATQQKQRRMIKNRESAARSRERKQAYTVELESLVTQLEEENARLLREEEELNKERYKQLMENLIPVTEKRRPPRVLRRVHSMEW